MQFLLTCRRVELNFILKTPDIPNNNLSFRFFSKHLFIVKIDYIFLNLSLTHSADIFLKFYTNLLTHIQ